MSVILNKPDSLSLAMNLKPFLISSSDVVSFQLLIGENILIEESYNPDSNNRVRIDIKEVVRRNLSVNFPTTDIFEQTDSCVLFTAVIDSAEVNFTIILAGVENFSDLASNFLSSNFLTWQQQAKKVTYSQPEWLTYYAIVAGYLKVKFYLIDGTTSIVTISAQAAYTCYTYNMQLSHIMSLQEGEKYGYFDVWFENATGSRLTYIQRYIYKDSSEEDEFYIFKNSLGGIDTVNFRGEKTFSPEITLQNAEYDEETVQSEVIHLRKYNKNTGWLSALEGKWIQDFFGSYNRYVLQDGQYKVITLNEALISDKSFDPVKGYSFTYIIANDQGLISISRSMEELPANIEIVLPEQLFFLAPRLSEWPSATLDDTLLFPVQVQAEEAWRTLTWGAIYSSLYEEFVSSPIAALAHAHSNLTVLNGLSEVGGQLYYKGEPIQSGSTAVQVINNLTSTSTSAALSANMGNYLLSLINTKQAIIPDNTYAPFSHLSDTLKHLSITERSNWNDAYSHISDSVKHITSTERTNWTSAYTASHSHSNISALNSITSTKVSNWDTAYSWGNHALAGYLTSASLGSLTNNLTTNYIVRWSGSAFVNSLIYDNGSGISIGNTAPGTYKFNVTGTGYFSGNLESAASVLAATSVKIGNWEIIKNGDSELQIKLSGTLKAKLSSAGVITADSIVLNSLVLNGHTLTIE